MTQLTLQLRPNVTVLAVLVPKNEHGDDVEGYEIRGAHPDRELEVLSFYGEANAKWLPPGKWEIIGLLREVSDDVAKELVIEGEPDFDTIDGRQQRWINWYSYLDGDYEQATAVASLQTAIVAAGGDPEDNYILLKQV